MFQWNFTGGQNAYDAAQQAAMKQKAAMDMQGYAPNGPEASYASQNMQGYDPMNTYLGRVSDRAGQPGSGQGYQFSDQEFEQYQQAQAQKEQRINHIRSEIASLQQSIAEKTAKLQNWTGNADKIAAIEASKINSSDPTMVWRWNEARKDAERQAELNRIASKTRDQLDNKTAQEKFQNTVDMLVGQRLDNSVEGREQQLKNIDAAIRDGRNINADVSRLLERKKQIEDKLDGVGEGVDDFKSGTRADNFKAMVNDYISADHSSNDMEKFYEENKKQMDDDTVSKFREAIRSKIKAEKDKYESDLTEYVKEINPDYDMLNESAKKRAREAAKKKRGY